MPNIYFGGRIQARHGGVAIVSGRIRDKDGNIIGSVVAGRDITERKKAEEVSAFHARLLSEVNDAVFSSDSNFTITYWNEAAERVFGWTKEEVLGKNCGELLKPKVEESSRDKERSKLWSEGHWEGVASVSSRCLMTILASLLPSCSSAGYSSSRNRQANPVDHRRAQRSRPCRC